MAVSWKEISEMKEILYLYISDIDLRKYSQVTCQILDKIPIMCRLW